MNKYIDVYRKKNLKVSIIGIVLLALIVGVCVLNGRDKDPVLTLTEECAMPIPGRQGRGEPMEKLIPQYAEEYLDDPYLSEAVVNFRRWEWSAAYSKADAVVQDNPDYLDAYRFQAEMYMINQNYEAALAQLDQILRRNPRDVHALGVTTILMRVLGNEAGELERTSALEMVCPEAAQAVNQLLQQTDDLLELDYGSQQLTDMVPDAIAVFGQTPKKDGTPSAGMLSRLEKALELAQRYPEAKIILSGGDVKTEFTEASVMYQWLVEQGVSEDRLIMDELARDTVGNAIGIVKALEEMDAHKVIAVGTIYHLPRATTTLTVYAQHVGYPLEVDCAGGGNVEAKNEGERLYTYISAARAGGLFSKSDFARFVD